MTVRILVEECWSSWTNEGAGSGSCRYEARPVESVEQVATNGS